MAVTDGAHAELQVLPEQRVSECVCVSVDQFRREKEIQREKKRKREKKKLIFHPSRENKLSQDEVLMMKKIVLSCKSEMFKK